MTRTAVRTRRLTSNISTVSSWAAWPLDVTRAWTPSGERATPQGPERPGPPVTVRMWPAGVIRQPDGVSGVWAAAPTVPEELDRAAVGALGDVHVHVRHAHASPSRATRPQPPFCSCSRPA